MIVRAALGFLVAALLPAVAGALLTPAVRGDIQALLGMTVVFLFFSAAAIALFGVPAFLLLHRFGLVRWWSAMGAGVLLGAIIGVAIRLPGTPQLQDLAVMALMGAASALVFWLVWRLGHAV